MIAILKGEIHGSTCNKLYVRKQIIDNCIFFPKGLNLCEDLIFNLKYLLRSTKISYLKDSLYYYLQHDDSLMRSLSMADQTSILFLRHIHDLQKHYPDILFLKKYLYQRYYGFIFNPAEKHQTTHDLRNRYQRIEAEYSPDWTFLDPFRRSLVLLIKYNYCYIAKIIHPAIWKIRRLIW